MAIRTSLLATVLIAASALACASAGAAEFMGRRADASDTTRTSGEVYSHDGQEDLTA